MEPGTRTMTLADIFSFFRNTMPGTWVPFPGPRTCISSPSLPPRFEHPADCLRVPLAVPPEGTGRSFASLRTSLYDHVQEPFISAWLLVVIGMPCHSCLGPCDAGGALRGVLLVQGRLGPSCLHVCMACLHQELTTCGSLEHEI